MQKLYTASLFKQRIAVESTKVTDSDCNGLSEEKFVKKSNGFHLDVIQNSLS